MYKPRGFYLRLPHHFCSVVYFFFLSLYILCGKKKIKKTNGTIYIKSYSYIVRSDLNVINLENLTIKICKPNSKPFLIASWYRPVLQPIYF